MFLQNLSFPTKAIQLPFLKHSALKKYFGDFHARKSCGRSSSRLGLYFYLKFAEGMNK